MGSWFSGQSSGDLICFPACVCLHFSTRIASRGGMCQFAGEVRCNKCKELGFFMGRCPRVALCNLYLYRRTKRRVRPSSQEALRSKSLH